MYSNGCLPCKTKNVQRTNQANRQYAAYKTAKGPNTCEITPAKLQTTKKLVAVLQNDILP